MKLSVWEKHGLSARLYINGAALADKAFIKLTANKAVIIKASTDEKQLIRKAFPKIFQTTFISDAALISAMKEHGYDLAGEGEISPNSFNQNNSPKKARSFSFAMKGIEDYHANSSGIDVHKCQFKASAIKNLYVIVDTREPKELLTLFKSSKIPDVRSEALPVGDILLGCHKTGAKVLIERKEVSDFSTSIKSSHAHDQAERLYDWETSELASGNDVKVIWAIESSTTNKVGMYSALKDVVNTAGMVGYLSGILDQYVVECYGKRHLVYLALKMLQCHTDKKLMNKVMSTNGNRGKADRARSLNNVDFSSKPNHGVSVGERTLQDLLCQLPNINSKVAANLASSGLTFAQIANLTVDSLVRVDGVGQKTAEKIHAMFNHS